MGVSLNGTASTTPLAITGTTQRYWLLGSAGLPAGIGQEAIVATPWLVAGTFSRLSVTATGNTISGTYSKPAIFRVNSANGTQTVAYTIGVTGIVTDTSNTDTVAAGDTANIHLQQGSGTGSGTIDFASFGCMFTPTDTTKTMWFSGAATSGGTTPPFDGTVRYTLPAGRANVTTGSDTNLRVPVNYAFTAMGLTLYVSTNSGSVSATGASYINGAAGAQSVTIGAAATGWFQDVSNTDSLSPGDDYSTTITPGVGTGSLRIEVQGMFLESTEGRFQTVLASGVSGFALPLGTAYTPVYGLIASTYAAELGSTVRMHYPMTASDMAIRVSANSLVGALNVRLRKSGANGNLLITVPAATTGFFEDTSNTDVISASDTVGHSFESAGGFGSATIRYNAVTWTNSAGTPRSYGYT